MSWNIEIENIAGIRDGSAVLKHGTNAVRGSNWQGKSSFITAIETVIGTKVSLTEGEDHGHVTLRTEDEELTVSLARRDGEVVRETDPYLTDEHAVVCSDLYAFFDERNSVRNAVRNQENLEELLTRPLDFENIDERIRDLNRERDQVDNELNRAKTAAQKRVELRSEVSTLERELAELERERDTLEPDDASEDLAGKRDELSDLRAEHNQVDGLIQQFERTIEQTKEKLEGHLTELMELDIPEADDIEDAIADADETARDRTRDAEILQSVYDANNRLLEEDRLHLLTDVSPGLVSDEISCWTCGSTADRAEYEAQLKELGDAVMEYRDEAQEAQAELSELQERRDEINHIEQRQDDLKSEIQRLESTLGDREESLTSAYRRKEELNERIEELEETVEDLDDRLTEIESEIKYKRAQIEDTREELEETERLTEQQDLLEAEREDLTKEIVELRNRKSEMKERTREAFDTAMQDILERFDTGFETARLTSTFDLVIARNGRSTSVDALSEGETELLAIVAMLAGLEAFDVTDKVPIILLDGLGGLAEKNLQTLIEYLDGRAPYVVFTTYPEQDSFEGNEISPEEWSVVSADNTIRAQH